VSEFTHEDERLQFDQEHEEDEEEHDEEREQQMQRVAWEEYLRSLRGEDPQDALSLDATGRAAGVSPNFLMGAPGDGEG
jgi:hypothetical protein